MDVLIKKQFDKLIIRKPLIRFKKIDLEAIWLKMQDEYFKARKLKPDNMKQIAKVESLVLLYDTLGILLRILARAEGEVLIKCKEQLKKHHYIIDESKPFHQEYKRLVNNREALTTAIELEKEKIEDYKPLTESYFLDDWNTMEDLKKRDLDPYKITEARWISMGEQELKKAQKRNE